MTTTTVTIDKEKVDRIVRETLTSLENNGAHPVEVIVALSQCVGRVIAAFGMHGASEVTLKELVDVAVKQMATAIEHGRNRVIL